MQVARRGIRFAWKTALFVLCLACLSVGQQPDIQNLVTRGNLEGMRWPNFSDYRNWLQKFYGPTGFAPAWLQASQPIPQALSLIEVFKDAGKKGLDPEDYDASRWEERIHALQGSSGGPAVARFDLALTVCTMRYVSDLRIGRINPAHFKFGLSVEKKKYDLAQFLRDQIMPASNLQAVLDGVDPPFAAYRRTEQALAMGGAEKLKKRRAQGLLNARERVVDYAVASPDNRLVIRLPRQTQAWAPVVPLRSRSPRPAIGRKLNLVAVRDASQCTVAGDTRRDPSLAAGRRQFVRTDPPVTI